MERIEAALDGLGSLSRWVAAQGQAQVLLTDAIPADSRPAMWLTGLMCGLRPGELAGLRWPYVTLDGDDPTIHVAERALEVDDKYVGQATPKTNRSKRTTGLHPLDAEGIIAAAFRQHTSRALDPQLHTHVVIANRVVSPDRRWLALDARTLKLDQRTLSAIYHTVLRSELTDRLGVEWQPVVNGIAEIAHLPDPVLEAFSTRTAGMQRRVDIKLDRFLDAFQRFLVRPGPGTLSAARLWNRAGGF